jgi:hypothetical protein
VNRLTISSAVCAVAIALLSGCSSDQSTAGPAAPAASAGPASESAAAPGPASAGQPAVSAPAAAKGKPTALCTKVAEAKTALNDELKKVVSADGKVSPADGKTVMTGLAAKLTALAGSDKGAVPEALRALAAEASKAAQAANPVEAASGQSFAAAGQKVDSACAAA